MRYANFCHMEKLANYLMNVSASQADFAAAVGITRGHMSALLSGVRLPSLDLAVRIERATSGQVPASSWVAEPQKQAEGEA